MIIENGLVEFGVQSGGGIAADGYATATTIAWGSPIPCQYRANTHNNLGRSNGEAFVACQYEILIDSDRNIPGVEKIRVFNAIGAQIGTFSVQSTEELKSVAQTRFLV